MNQGIEQMDLVSSHALTTHIKIIVLILVVKVYVFDIRMIIIGLFLMLYLLDFHVQESKLTRGSEKQVFVILAKQLVLDLKR